MEHKRWELQRAALGQYALVLVCGHGQVQELKGQLICRALDAHAAALAAKTPLTSDLLPSAVAALNVDVRDDDQVRAKPAV